MRKLCLFLLFILGTFTVRAADYLLSGSIKNFPIVLKISTGDDKDNTCSAVYFYTSSGKDIELNGAVKENVYTLKGTIRNSKTDKYTVTETFVLVKQANNNWTGTWTDKKGKTYPVSLSPVNIPAVKHTYAQLPLVSHQKEAEPYEYLRTATYKLIEDSTVKKGNYTLAYCHINKSPVYFFRIAGDQNKNLVEKINNVLLNKMFEEAAMFFSCTTEYGEGYFDYSISNVYITDNIISLSYNDAVDCGGAHPESSESSINIDVKTGNELELEDVLYLGAVTSAVPESDIWLEYRDKIYCPELLHLLKSLYPTEIGNGEDKDGCDYSTKDLWNFPDWHFTSKGLYISPSFPHVAAPCRNPEWSYISYAVLKKHKNPNKNISLP